MKITILFFGIIKDITERDVLLLEDQKITSVSHLKNYLIEKYPKLSKYSNFSVAVNEEYVEENCNLNSNDVVAIIPPVSGG